MSRQSVSDRARLGEVRGLALSIMAEHGLAGWSFDYDRARRRKGSCTHRKKLITLSEPFVLLNDNDAIRLTILHEIAHALVGPGHGHDAVWKAKCLEVGAQPRRCGEADMPPGR